MFVANIRRFLLGSGLALCILSGSISFAQSKPHVFDFRKINAAIADVLLPLYKSDPIVTNVAFKLEPKTDLVANRLAVSASTTVQRSSWSASPAALTTTLSGEAKPGATARTVQLGIQLSLNMKTESLAFIKYLIQLSESTNRTCASPVNVEPFEQEIELFLCGQQQKILAAKDLVELRVVFESTRVGAEAVVQKYLDKVIQQLASNPTPVVGQQLRDSKKSLEESLNFVQAIRVSIRKDSNENEIGFETEISKAYAYSSLSLKQVRMVIEQDQSELEVALQVNEFERAQFMQFKALAENYFMALEAEDQDTLQSIAEIAKEYMKMVKDVTRDRKQSP